jgi:hypothetical protein
MENESRNGQRITIVCHFVFLFIFFFFYLFLFLIFSFNLLFCLFSIQIDATVFIFYNDPLNEWIWNLFLMAPFYEFICSSLFTSSQILLIFYYVQWFLEFINVLHNYMKSDKIIRFVLNSYVMVFVADSCSIVRTDILSASRSLCCPDVRYSNHK